MLQHIEDNPCLTYEWKAVWPMLKEAGWSQVTGNSAAKKVQYIYSKLPSGVKPQLGVTRFDSKLALCTYINRFPYTLQDDMHFAKTLERHGWIKLRGNRFSNTESNMAMTTSVRRRGRTPVFYSAQSDSQGNWDEGTDEGHCSAEFGARSRSRA